MSGSGAIIRIKRDPEQALIASRGQLSHHRSRRLAHILNTRSNNNSSPSKNTNYDWRAIIPPIPQNHRNLDHGEEGHADIIYLSNCYLVKWAGEIAVGSPPQIFQVEFDTAFADMWIPSAKCDNTCDRFFEVEEEGFKVNHYAHQFSSSYSSILTPTDGEEDKDKHLFAVKTREGTLTGKKAIDVVQVGQFTIDSQVFGEVTHFSDDFSTCKNVMGKIGLGFPQKSHVTEPTVMENIASLLYKPMFSFYLNSEINDYNIEGMQTPLNQFGDPFSVSSELVLGGVDQNRYDGCLTWHNRLESNVMFWDVALDDVRSMGETILTSKDQAMAIFDTGSTNIIGPIEVVRVFVVANNGRCFIAPENDGGVMDEVDCSSQEGFDLVRMPCDKRDFIPLEFVIDGISYAFGEVELIALVDPTENYCDLRITPSMDMSMWIFGDPFFNKYYTAFDFRDMKIGMAPASSSDGSVVCEEDKHLDVFNVMGVVNEQDMDDGTYDEGDEDLIIYEDDEEFSIEEEEEIFEEIEEIKEEIDFFEEEISKLDELDDSPLMDDYGILDDNVDEIEEIKGEIEYVEEEISNLDVEPFDDLVDELAVLLPAADDAILDENLQGDTSSTLSNVETEPETSQDEMKQYAKIGSIVFFLTVVVLFVLVRRLRKRREFLARSRNYDNTLEMSNFDDDVDMDIVDDWGDAQDEHFLNPIS